MKQVFLSKKGIEVIDVPNPKIEKKELLVKNSFSCISPGTELAGVKSISQNILKKILEKPHSLKQALKSLNESGIRNTSRIIKKKLNTYYELGYSSAGVVIEVGQDVKKIKKGDLVACCGGGVASHAEIISVPENLTVKVSDINSMDSYSSVALGSTSLQGVRRLSPTLGENHLVVGLGFIGQITIQILSANGCKVYGIDPNSFFINKAKENNFINLYRSFEELKKNISPEILDNGFDGSIITASSESNEILSEVFKLCRKKARVVVVGDIGLKINREDIYKKEIDFLISTSYGPGRYDENYEKNSVDYPKEYVRWTLNRNMQAYIDLIDNKKVNLSNLIDKKVKIDKAPILYENFRKAIRPISAVIEYSKKEISYENYKQKISVNKKSKFNSAIVGVGGFSQEILIPNLRKMSKKNIIKTLCVKKPISALNLSNEYKDITITNSFDEILNDKTIDVVFITTRHNLHFDYVIKALKRGKNVFCEKPLCVSKKELVQIKNFFLRNNKKNQVLVTGFNRRFSESTKIIKDFINNEKTPVIINYTVNAEHIPYESWIYKKEGAGRNIGEGCHFYDLILHLMNDICVDVKAISLSNKVDSFSHNTDNFTVALKFSNGGIAQLNYLTYGAKNSFKELVEVRGYKRSLLSYDFKLIKLFEESKEKTLYTSVKSNKGHFEQYEIFFNCLENKSFSIPIKDQIRAMEICFEVEEQI